MEFLILLLTLAISVFAVEKHDLKAYEVQICLGEEVPFSTGTGSMLFGCPNPSTYKVALPDAYTTGANFIDVRAEIAEAPGCLPEEDLSARRIGSTGGRRAESDRAGEEGLEGRTEGGGRRPPSEREDEDPAVIDEGDEGESKVAAAVCRANKDTCMRLTFTNTDGNHAGHVETAGQTPCVFVKESGTTATVDVDTNGFNIGLSGVISGGATIITTEVVRGCSTSPRRSSRSTTTRTSCGRSSG